MENNVFTSYAIQLLCNMYSPVRYYVHCGTDGCTFIRILNVIITYLVKVFTYMTCCTQLLYRSILCYIIVKVRICILSFVHIVTKYIMLSLWELKLCGRLVQYKERSSQEKVMEYLAYFGIIYLFSERNAVLFQY